MNKDKIMQELELNYNFLVEQLQDARNQIEMNGRVVQSKANGLVKSPEVVAYDTFAKQLIAIVKQMQSLDESKKALEDNTDELVQFLKKGK